MHYIKEINQTGSQFEITYYEPIDHSLGYYEDNLTYYTLTVDTQDEVYEIIDNLHKTGIISE